MRSVIFAILCLAVLSGPAAGEAPARVPVIYCTDLFHPHDDPDDHFDLACLYALDELDIRGIVLDQGERQAKAPGRIAIAQMNHLTGRNVPCATGLSSALAHPGDTGAARPAAHQAGIELILRSLRAAKSPVTIITVGSLRDVAAALNREPELFREKVGRLLVFIGAVNTKKPEWNVQLDPHAFVRVMGSGLPVFWVPCFDGGLFRNDGLASFWRADHADLLRHASDRVLRFFVYALQKKTDADPVGFLDREATSEDLAAVRKGTRNLWCAAVFPVVAGRRVAMRRGDWRYVPPDDLKDGELTFEPFRFRPVRIAVEPDARIVFEESERAVPIRRFEVRFHVRYPEVMTSLTANLIGELDAGADRPVIANPVLRGFRPDPSILRVGEDFYIATSTFEWFPGVEIHRSRDLVHWSLAGHALTRTSQLDMRGNPCSGGVWAPDLTWHDGTFYLVYTNVRNGGGGLVDAHNYLVTARSAEGPWSDPVYLHSRGFDPALYFDDDGKAWLLNLKWDHRLPKKSAGIEMQRLDLTSKKLLGEPRVIFVGTAAGGTEAPHVYRHDGYYHLMTAEGGTWYDHQVTMARAKKLEGPWEVDPGGPLLTSKDAPDLPLQKAGHACLVDTPNGELYVAYLCARPLPGTRRCPLGRETALRRVEWSKDGWLRVAGGGHDPVVAEVAPDLRPHPWVPPSGRDSFTRDRLPLRLKTLRTPPDASWLSLTKLPGLLRLRGRESLNSTFDVSLVARRLPSVHCEATTNLVFAPESAQQMAGLVLFYNHRNYRYLRVSRDDDGHRNVAVLSLDRGRMAISEPVRIEPDALCFLRARVDGARLTFHHSADGETFRSVGPEYDTGKLSDDYCRGFTGTMVGVTVQDPTGARIAAAFDFLEIREREPE